MSENEHTESNTLPIEGILDINENKSGVLLDPARGGKTTPNDPFLPKELIRRFKLKRGSFIQADGVQNQNRPSPKVRFIHTVDGLSLKDRKALFRFDQLTTIQPKEKLNLECKDGRMTTRVLDLFCPIGKGQRGLIVAPPELVKQPFYMISPKVSKKITQIATSWFYWSMKDLRRLPILDGPYRQKFLLLPMMKK